MFKHYGDLQEQHYQNWKTETKTINDNFMTRMEHFLNMMKTFISQTDHSIYTIKWEW